MKVILVSQDPDLLNMCREILNEYHGLAYHLSSATPDAPLSGGDLYIWDGAEMVDFAREIDQPFPKHLLLLQQSEVARLHGDLGNVGAAILLKPVSRSCLSAFLGFAASTFQDRISTPHSLRSDRNEMLQCLIQSNLQLQQYEQDRTNFLTRAVHDFRAPLTATGGYCGLLFSGALGPLSEEQKEVLGRMQQSIKRLSRMASAMFELGVGRQVKRRPDVRPADIRELVDQALHEITPFADGKNISVSAELVPEEGTMYLEPGQIEQVLVNLLDNACKFTPKAGAIEIQGYPFFWERRAGDQSYSPIVDRRNRDLRSPNSYRIDIRDSGPQIPVEHIGKIFEEYTSYVGGQDRSGGGLGLAICRMIIQAHEGRVWMENTDYGPMFSFVLPVRFAKSGAPHIEDEVQLTVSEAR
jgi:signal transduction histidine kinase